MEEKINIAEILRNKPSDIKLYSPIFGDCTYCYIHDETSDICVKKQCKVMIYFNFEGLYDTAGECLLFPSKEMRDWSKFAWKKGDVLVSNDYGIEVIFYDWYDDTYTSFYCKHYLNSEDKNKIVYYEEFLCTTARYSLEDRDAAQTYINTIEERLDGKLNLKTLEIEKKPEFKNGDIVFVRCDKYNYIEIFNYFENNGDLYDHASLNIIRQSLDTSGILKILKEGILEIRLATDSEKQQLFNALAKEGKVWDAERKDIVDLKPKWTPKPFDRVITRTPETPWTANFFSHIDSDGIKNCIDDRYIMCLPYNEKTAKLIGTTNNWDG